MIRRDFMKNIASLLGLAALPVAVAGKEMSPGKRLELVREPANPFDANAIRIDWIGRKLGYTPRMQNQATARLLDEGRHLYARVGDKTRHPNPWQRIEVEVWLVV